jgi:hypothetical protein
MNNIRDYDETAKGLQDQSILLLIPDESHLGRQMFG